MAHVLEEYSALMQENPISINSIISSSINFKVKEFFFSSFSGQFNISYLKVHPVLLPSLLHLSDLIFRDCGELIRQKSVLETLTQLRERRAKQRIIILIFRNNLSGKFCVKPAIHIPALAPWSKITLIQSNGY